MKRFLLIIFVFIAFIFLIDRGVGHFFSTLVDRSNFRFSRVSKLDTNDIVVIGNSRGVNSVNEKYCNDSLNVNLINLSYNGMTPELLIYLIKDLSKRKVHNNSIFLIELSAFIGWEEGTIDDNCRGDFSIITNSNIPDFILPYRKGFKSIDSILNKQYPINKVFNILDYNSEGFRRSIYYLFKSDNDWINNGQISESLINYYSNMECVQFSFVQNSFEKLLDYLINNKIRYCFFIAPWHNVYKEKFANYDRLLTHITDQYNEKIIRLDLIKLKSTAFADGMHTNRNTDRLLTRSLLDSVCILNKNRTY